MRQAEGEGDTPLALNARIVAREGVVFREEFDDWAVLFDPDTGVAMGINPVGVAIWRLLGRRRTLQQILEELRISFSGVPDTGMAELEVFVQDLLEARLVYEASAISPSPSGDS